MEIDSKSQKLIDLISEERDPEKLLRHVQELNQRLEEQHRIRRLALESPLDGHDKKKTK